MHEPEHTTEDWLSDELIRFEDQLAELSADSPRVDRDELMFAAGRASVAGGIGRWAWPIATAVSSAAAAVLAVMLVGLGSAPSEAGRSQQIEVVQLVPDTSTTQQPAALTSARRELPRPVTVLGGGYLAQRQWALAHGIDARVPPMGGQPEVRGDMGGTPVTVRDLLDELTSNAAYRGKTTG